ncbi:MAG: hypothetical protein RMJ17_02765 [Candidatus Aenigmarchaeota archaeon]|nr:hypothetical protein [Candidatus Aenigmarchaeota archaeon]MDW8149490.1 hypothetical protein [Candidatus Aenigmarchaeota archaeon]
MSEKVSLTLKQAKYFKLYVILPYFPFVVQRLEEVDATTFVVSEWEKLL